MTLQFSKKIAGVDGCKGGWFAFFLDGGRLRSQMFGSIGELFNAVDADLILIDIPIGLRDEGPLERLCDLGARKILSPKRKPSVFRTPSRTSLNENNHSNASSTNRRYTGKGLSKQSFNIMPKIKEVDGFIQSSIYRLHKGKSVIREAHPEVCFWGLSGGLEMRHSKKEYLGKCERVQLLKRYLPEAEVLLSHAREGNRKGQVADDDMIDALCCAVTAMHSDFLSTFPTQPEVDSKGVVMEIVYCDPAF